MGTGTTGLQLYLISNEAHPYNDTTAGCYLEAPVKGGAIHTER